MMDGDEIGSYGHAVLLPGQDVMRLSRRGLIKTGLFAPVVLRGTSGFAQSKKTIRSVPIGDLKVLDPIWSTAYITRNHAYLVWDTLFALDEHNQPRPQMVDSTEVSDDKTSYTFTLRRGLSWHDGAPVRAADCVASIRRWAAKDGMGRALMAVSSDLKALDDRTIRLTLQRPVGFVLDALGKIDSNVPFMMPERLAQTDPNTQITEAIGSGPFRFVKQEWVPGVKAIYEKFTDYVPRAEPPSQAAGGKLVHIDRVESLYTPDPSVAANALINGEFDLLESPAPDLAELLKRSANVTVAPNDPRGYQLFMVINHTLPPFDKPAARQALMMAVKQSDFMLGTVGDKSPWRECAAVFGCSPGEGALREELGWPPYDVAKAKALLASSGYDGRPIVIMDPADNATLHPGALLTADVIRQIGGKPDVQVMDWSTLTQRRASKAPVDQGGWNLFVTNATVTGISNPLLDNYAKHCDSAWYGWPCDPAVVALTDAWAAETDPARRRQLTLDLERLHLKDVTQVPLGQYQSLIAYRKNLTGVIPGPALFYWGIDKA
jgi:peptide/nickel transport system substrate-binding protein